MHHLGPNSILYLACFAMPCEAYLGLLSFPSFFRHLFHFRAQTQRLGPSSCGDTMVYRRASRLLPRMMFMESFKKWQRTFFYTRSIGLGQDWVNLPPLSYEPPIGVHSDLDLRNDELAVIAGRMQELVASMGLLAPDLVAAFVACHVLPLQARPHQMRDMSGRKDPSRLLELPLHKVAARVNKITNFQLDEEEWSFGLEPYHRGNRVLVAEASALKVEQVAPLAVEHAAMVRLQMERRMKSKAAPTVASSAIGPSAEATSDAASPTEQAKREAIFHDMVDICRYTKTCYCKARADLTTRTTELEAAKADFLFDFCAMAAILKAKVEELRQSLSDVRGKLDEIAGLHDRLEKDLTAEWAATTTLRERDAGEGGARCGGASGRATPSGLRAGQGCRLVGGGGGACLRGPGGLSLSPLGPAHKGGPGRCLVPLADRVEGVPESRVATWLGHAAHRFDAWRASTARAGARIALSFAVSWYFGVNLERLSTLRAVHADLTSHEEDISFRAHELASYATLDTYFPELGEDGVPILEDDYGVLIIAGNEEVASNSEEPEGDEGATEAAAGGADKSSAQETQPRANDGEVQPTGMAKCR
ncbi:hypothetical protein D1007_60976 [Hordeum vulgare]|nr:hypothetical protein D1007_60976 [Hordeum vulgare]